MLKENILNSPVGDYQLVDLGAGRKLERFGEYLIDRPAPQAEGLPQLTAWQPHWRYSGQRVATGEWQAAALGLPDSWGIEMAGQRMQVRLSPGGQTGIYPEHVLCWHWVRECLATGSDTGKIEVLNLFAGTGGTTLAAAQAGAMVTHVDAQTSQIALAKQNNAAADVRWVREDVMSYVARALKRGQRYDMIIMDPPSFGRGPKGQTWDIECDLGRLLESLPQLLTAEPRGVWLSLHTPAISQAQLQQHLVELLPCHVVTAMSLAIATQDQRLLTAGNAVISDTNAQSLRQ